ncbi:MAG TPA: response regulator transcription factor [Verrucomicrobiae bacterium]|nr:response regulator transcription factor [Verrucomicrobiae bacterium]
MISVLVLHSQRLIREIWTSFVTSRHGIRVVAAAHNLEEAATLARYVKPRVGVISLDLITSGTIKGLAAIRAASPHSCLILVTAADPTSLRGRLSEVGVSRCLSENSSLNTLETAILEVDAGLEMELASPSGYTGQVAAGVSQLTKREFDILELLEKGKTSKEIGIALNMSYRTVEVHRYHLLKKMDCKRTTELLRKMSAWAAH